MNKIVKLVALISLFFILVVSSIYIFIFSHTYDTPILSGVIAGDDGINISWESVETAEFYAVLRKTDGKWKKIADINGTSYVDSNVVFGETYYYTVRCEDEKCNQYLSGYDKQGIGLTYLSTPVLNGCSIFGNGINITWNNVEDAEGYRIFRKEGNEGWNRIADVTGAVTTYTDTTAVSSGTYAYTVRCISADAKWYTSGYEVEGMSIGLLDTPEVVSVDAVISGVEVKWKEVKNAEGYRVFRKEESGQWEPLSDITPDITKYVDEDTLYGVQYYYTVRCISMDAATYTSKYYDGFGIIRCETPMLKSISGMESGIEVSWEMVNTAERYRIFRKINDEEKWTIIDTVDNNKSSFIDEDVIHGNTYIYTVRCMDENETQFTSSHDLTGIRMEY